MPPRSGWTWQDGQPRNELQVVSAGEQSDLARATAKAQKEDGDAAMRADEDQEQKQQAISAEWDERLQRATDQVDAVEVEASQALELAKLASDDTLGLNDDSAVRALELLGAQSQPLLKLQRVALNEGLLKPDAPPHIRGAASELTQRARTLQTHVKAAERLLLNMRRERAIREEADRKRAQDEARGRVLEAKHSAELEGMMSAAVEKVEAVHDEIEKVVVAATPLEVEAMDYIESAMTQAVEETERCAKAANAALLEARRVVTAKVAQVRRLIPGAKLPILDEFSALQNRLNEAQAKLAPYSAVRQTHQQRLQVKKVVDELSEQLSSAEVEVEKAIMASTPLFGASVDAAREAEKPLATAQAAVNRIARVLEARTKGAQKGGEVMRQGLVDIQERMNQMQDRLKEAQQAVRDMQARAVADKWLQEISVHRETIESELQRMMDAESVFEDEERQAREEDEAAATEIDKIGPSVQSALSSAQGFCRRMLAQVARSASGPVEEVRDGVTELQNRIEEGQGKLKQFNSSALDMKRKQLVRKMEKAVSAAEEDVQRLAEDTDALGGSGVADEMAVDTSDQLKQVTIAERAVQTRIVAARKCVIDVTSQLRQFPGASSTASPEIESMQTRLNKVQQETTRLRKACKDAEERLVAQQLLQEVATQVKGVEAEVDEAIGATAALGDEDPPSADSVENAERLIALAQTKVVNTAKAVNLRAKTARGVVAEDLKGMEARLKQAQESLTSSSYSVKAHSERIRANHIVAQVTERVELAEAEVQKVSEAQAPFLSDVEMSVGDAQVALATCEAALSSAQKAIFDGKAFIGKVITDARRLSGDRSAKCIGEIKGLQGQLDASAARLKEIQEGTGERKRAIQQKLAEEKIAVVESAAEKLKALLDELTNDKLSSLSAEEAHAACEGLAGADQEAGVAMSSAQDFLAGLLTEAKSLGAQGAAMTAEVSKAQSRLRQHQVELARLARGCQERKQRVLAQQLLREVPPKIEAIEADVQEAHKVAAPLVASDKAVMLEELRVQSVIVSLRAHMKEQNLGPDALFAKIAAGATATAEELSAFLELLPPSEPSGAFLLSLSAEQAAGALAQLAKNAGSGDGGLSAAVFRALLRDRLRCRTRVTCSGSPEEAGGDGATALEPGEVVEVVERQETMDGSTRAECVRTRDGTTAWVTLRSPDGTSQFELSLSNAARVESIVAYTEALCARCAEVAVHAEQKAGECAASAQQHASLADVRSKLLQLKMQVNVHKVKMDQLRKRVVSTKEALLQQWEMSKQRSQDGRSKLLLDKSIKDALAAVTATEEKANKLVDNIKSEPTFLQQEDSAAQVQSIKKAVEEASKACAEAKAATERFAESPEGGKGPNRSHVLKTRVELMKLSSRCATLEKKCRTAAEALW